MTDLYLEYIKKYPPTIIPNGWWWKKHFKKYRDLKETMDALAKYTWENGGAEEWVKEMRKAFEDSVEKEAFKVFEYGFSLREIK